MLLQGLVTLSFLVSQYAIAQIRIDTIKGKIVYDSTVTVQIDPKASPLSFHLVSREQSGGYAYDILIQRFPSNDTVQVIRTGSQLEEPEISFVDIDFDGDSDLMLNKGMLGNSGNTGYDFWIYDSSEGGFHYNQGLSDTLGHNTYIDTEAKEVTSGGTGGCAGVCYKYRTFRWTGTSFKLVKREYVDYDPADPNKQALIWIVEELVGDSMKVVEKEQPYLIKDR